MKMTAEDIYAVNESSLKDAIVHFGGFCTGEVISDQGLLLTNHHCGYRQIQSHSTLENNYLEEGFWAKEREEEIPNPGLFARFIREIKEVTPLVLNGVTDDMSEKERSDKIDENIETVKGQFELKPHESVEVKPYYNGNQFYALKSVRYDDVRLVGAPPSSIGKFGADTDNWVWPRHTGDFSLFRIYASPDNEPAAYSEENVPYTPEHFLPISLDGVDEGDFTLIFGFPGSTHEYLPAIAIEQLVNDINPARIEIRDQALEVMDKAMRADPEVKIQYASKFASIANYWKKWQGENLGLSRTNAVEKKRAEEIAFRQKLRQDNDLLAKYEGTLDLLKSNYERSLPLRRADAIYGEILQRNVDGIRMAGYFSRLIGFYENGGEEAFSKFSGRLLPFLKSLHKNFNAEVDKKLAVRLMQSYLELMPGEFVPRVLAENENTLSDFISDYYSISKIPSGDILDILENDSPSVAVDQIKADPLVQLAAEFDELYREKILGQLAEIETERDSLMRHYMAAQLKVADEDARIFPDANSTLRAGYGRVASYQPKDAVKYLHQTHLEGVMEKYEPGDYEFDVPARLIELYESKDYGDYGENGKMPVCFIGSNHTTGGNSGSPAIDAHGNLIGLNFDRAWEGTMSDYNYDFSLCRNIMVDARYILFIIDKYGRADHLINEMKLVHPKAE
jgi:hypothetical protein